MKMCNFRCEDRNTLCMQAEGRRKGGMWEGGYLNKFSRYLRTQQRPFLPRPTSIFRQRLQYAGLLKCFRRHTWMPSSFNVVLSTPARGRGEGRLIYHLKTA